MVHPHVPLGEARGPRRLWKTTGDRIGQQGQRLGPSGGCFFFVFFLFFLFVFFGGGWGGGGLLR